MIRQGILLHITTTALTTPIA